MTILTLSDLVGKTSTSYNLPFSSAHGSAAWFLDMNRTSATFSTQLPATPASASSGGTVHTDVEAGFPNLQQTSNTRYISSTLSDSTNMGTIHIYDRVWSCSGISGSVTTPQIVSSFPSLPARAGTGEGLEIWIEIYTAIGSTQFDVVVEYTNNLGVAGRTTISSSRLSSNAANQMFMLLLQSGDAGVQSIQSITLSTSSGSAGNMGIVLMRHLSTTRCIGTNAPKKVVNDFASTFMPKVPDGTALQLVAWLGNGGGSGILKIVDG